MTLVYLFKYREGRPGRRIAGFQESGRPAAAAKTSPFMPFNLISPGPSAVLRHEPG